MLSVFPGHDNHCLAIKRCDCAIIDRNVFQRNAIFFIMGWDPINDRMYSLHQAADCHNGNEMSDMAGS